MSSLMRPSRVALALHKAGSSTPFGVTGEMAACALGLHVCAARAAEQERRVEPTPARSVAARSPSPL